MENVYRLKYQIEWKKGEAQTWDDAILEIIFKIIIIIVYTFW